MRTWFGWCVSCWFPCAFRAQRPLWQLAVLGAIALLSSSSAAAQSEKRRLLLLESTPPNVPQQMQARVDHALRAAADRHGTIALETSPLPFEDIAMAAGCGDRGDACGARIVATLDDDALLVRELELSEAGVLTVRLVAHERGSGEARAAEADLGSDGPNTPELALPRLFAQLYGSSELSEPVPAAAVAPAPSRPSSPPAARAAETVAVEDSPAAKDDVSTEADKSFPLRAVGWSLAAVGVGLLTAGVAVGSISQREHREYADVNIEDPEDADLAHSHLDRAKKRARQANGLFVGGAAAAAVGVGVLLYAYLRGTDRKPTTSFLIAPEAKGVVFALRGSLSP